MNEFISSLRVASLSLVLVATSSHADTIYVNAAVSGGTGDGSSWTNAFRNLQDALQSGTSGDQIWIAKGVYYPDEGEGQIDDDRDSTFQLPDGIALYGGFLSGQISRNQRDPELNVTILSGDLSQDDDDENGDHIIESVSDLKNGGNARHILTATDEFILDGFLINAGDGGSTNAGGGLLANGSSPTVRNCTFLANRGSNAGAVIAHQSSGFFEDCLFKGNVGNFRGGGMLALTSSLKILNCNFIGNSGASTGGALEVSTGKIAGCRFSGNVSVNGSALYVRGGTQRVFNCVFHNNLASGNGTFYMKNGPGSVIGNCTFSGNTAGSLGAGIYAEQLGVTTITHCLIWGNESEESGDGVDVHVEGMTIPAYRHCLIEGWNPAGIGNLDGTKEFNAPLFVNPAMAGSGSFEGVDLRLKPNSPGINLGDAAELARDWLDLDDDGQTVDKLPIDADGNPRVIFSKPDLGAYEATSSILHVKVGPPDEGGDGASWNQALTSLAKALEIAEAGQDIWVTEGVYFPTVGNSAASGELDQSVSFVLKSGVGLYGGFVGHETEFSDRMPARQRSILSGDIDGDDLADELFTHRQIVGKNSYHVVDGCDTDDTAILDGFIITAGQAGESVPGTLNNQGGGILIEDGGARIRNCAITGNSALHGSGGGAHCRGGAKPSFTNCLFSGNAALLGGASIVSSQSDVVFVNCTMTANGTTQDSERAGALYVAGAKIEMENCIVWGNETANPSKSLSSISYFSATGKIRNSLVAHSNGSGDTWEENLGSDEGGNIDASPSFVSSLDYRLRFNSPCIDAGNNSADLDGDGSESITITDLVFADLDGVSRFADGDRNRSVMIDMGAFEYQGQLVTDTDGDGLSDFFEVTHTNQESETLLKADLDHDNDGRSNLEEYVFGLDPFVKEPAFETKLIEINGKSFFAVEFPYDPNSERFVEMLIDWSHDLKNWGSNGESIVQLETVDFSRLYRIRASEKQMTSGRSFVRFVVNKK